MTRRLKELDNGAGAEVRAADTDNDEYIAELFYLFGSLFDPAELVVVVIFGEIEPAEHFGAGAGLAAQGAVGSGDLGLYRLKLIRRNKRRNKFFTQIESHDCAHLS